MNFDITDEERMLAETTRDVLIKHYGSTEERNKISMSELGWSRELWATLADLGILGLAFEEADGGMGAGPVEMMLVPDFSEIRSSLIRSKLQPRTIGP